MEMKVKVKVKDLTVGELKTLISDTVKVVKRDG